MVSSHIPLIFSVSSSFPLVSIYSSKLVFFIKPAHLGIPVWYLNTQGRRRLISYPLALHPTSGTVGGKYSDQERLGILESHLQVMITLVQTSPKLRTTLPLLPLTTLQPRTQNQSQPTTFPSIYSPPSCLNSQVPTPL